MPDWKAEIRARLAALQLAPSREAEIVDELAEHLEDRYEELLGGGASATRAYELTLVELSDADALTRQLRVVERPVTSEPPVWGARRTAMIADFWQDLRYAVRGLRKHPGFAAVAVLSLGLGLGANTALFSLVDAVLLKPLPVERPYELVLFNWESGRAFRTSGMRGTFVRGGYTEGKRGSSSFHGRVFAKMREAQQQAPASQLAELFAFAWLGQLNVLADGQAEVASAQAVSGNYFAGLRLSPLHGRLIAEADDDAAAAPVVVLNHAYWQERFGADPAIIGRQITLNQVSFTVIGVTPQGFDGALQVGQRPAVSVPLAFQPQLEPERPAIDRPNRPALWWLNVMGRLKPGATREGAWEELNGAFQAEALALMPPPRRENETAVIEAQDYPNLIAREGSQGMWEMRYIYSSSIYLLFGVVALVLLIACANVANLMLARAATRSGEVTVRLALGASRGRLMRQLLTESLLLALLGGALGALLAIWGKEALARLGGGMLPSGVEYSLNWRVLGFTALVSLLTGMLFGMAPAWRATRQDLTTALKESRRSSSGITRSRLSRALVVAQVALSLVLLIGAGLFLRTLRNLQEIEVGFNQENLLLFAMQPRTNGYKEERLTQFYEQLFARLESLPGVQSASFASMPLLAHYMDNSRLLLPGETMQSSETRLTNLLTVRENFFATMEIPLLRGRGFLASDNQRAPRVAIISEALAQKYFPDEDPIGKRVGLDGDTLGKIEIIGVVRDIKYNSQREEIAPLLYTSWLQNTENIGGMHFALRTAGDPVNLVAAVRQAVREVDINVPVVEVKTQVSQSSETLAQERFFATLLGFFAALAVLLAGIGLYGVMAYSVAQRTNEIGIRIALGAQTRHVLRMVIWQGLRLTLAGLLLGALAAWALKQVVASQLYGVQATDPATFFAVAALLLLIALVACWLPARRATRVDPLAALRYE